MKKISFLAVILLLACSGSSYAADYYYATTDMSWAEFYAGETNSTAAQLQSQGLDAISTPTTHGLSRFPLLWGQSIDQIGTTISGEKAVQVRMSEEVYNSFSDLEKSRFNFVDTEFAEYKEVNSDGSFGKMTTQESKPSGASVSLASGASARWGHYVLSVSGAEIEIGSANRYCDYYLGATLETGDGKIYGLRHDNNLWSNTDIAFTLSENYTEPHGNGTKRFYQYTSDLEGKTITKITYMLKDKPDVVIDGLNIFVKRQTNASVKTEEEFIEAGQNVPVKLTFENLPEGANYEISSVSFGSGRNSQPVTDYAYQNGTLIIHGALQSGTYTATFRDNNYVDIGASIKVFTTDATSQIISDDNNLAGVNFLLTPAGVFSSVDAAMTANNFVNASDYTDPAQNYSATYSGGKNQVAGSGFSFDIALNDVPPGKTAVVGFGKIFYLTPENLGELYSSVYQSINALPAYPSGYRGIFGNQFKALGLRVMGIYDGEVADVTENVGAGALISDDAHIMIYYGVMLADCNYGEINEGGEYAFSEEGETLLSDRKRDGHLKITWYFEALNDNAQVIDASANSANVEFKTMPAGFFASADANADSKKLIWLNDENVLAGGSSEITTGKPNQISGYKFTVPIDAAKIPEGYTVMLGFENTFEFTEENLGSRDYQALRTNIASLPKAQGSDWVTPEDGDALTSAGVHVMASYPDAGLPDSEVTGLMSYGLLEQDNSILMTCGAIAVDREITNNEGEILDIVIEQVPLISDGKADGKISVSWYITHNTERIDPVNVVLGSASGGCNAANFLIPVVILAFLRRK